MQPLFDVINAPTLALLNRPLIGNGADGTAANPNGQAGGLLIGNGGNGFSPAAGPGGNGGAPDCWATAATAAWAPGRPTAGPVELEAAYYAQRQRPAAG